MAPPSEACFGACMICGRLDVSHLANDTSREILPQIQGFYRQSHEDYILELFLTGRTPNPYLW